MEVVTKAFVKRTPFAARSSIFGVWIMGLPMHPSVSQRWSSVSRKIMFGGFGVKDKAVRSSPRQPVIGIAAAPVAASRRNRRRLIFFIFLLQIFITYNQYDTC